MAEPDSYGLFAFVAHTLAPACDSVCIAHRVFLCVGVTATYCYEMIREGRTEHRTGVCEALVSYSNCIDSVDTTAGGLWTLGALYA